MEVNQRDRERSRKFMMYLAMFAIFIFFAALGSYQIVRQAEGAWFQFDIPFQFTKSTIVLVVSSLTMIFGTVFTKKGNKWLATLFIFSTLILGIIFTYLQWEGWKELVKNDIYFSDPRSKNNSGSLFYVITALHLAHLIGGLFSLLVTTIRSAAGKYNPQNYLGVKLCGMYWHFLDGLWLYLFLFWNYSDRIF